MSELMDTVRAGHKGQTVRLLDTMTDAERRAHMPELKALRKELRATRWDAPGRRAYPSLYVAGIVCQTGASAVAAWIAASDMRWPSTSPALLLRLLGDRPAEWLGDLAQRLAQRPVSSGVSYPLMSGLVRLAGCPVPTTEAYVRGWVDDLEVNRERGGTLLDRLRSDPHLEPMAGALFETNDIGGRLIWSADKGPDGWIGALALVCAEGRLDRKVVVERVCGTAAAGRHHGRQPGLPEPAHRPRPHAGGTPRAGRGLAGARLGRAVDGGRARPVRPR
ncbi:hypothetical protein [Streptomyces sp. ACT015]|uniref:hypothetical protein n=1 Tax=Streptomyces sp. ACT015 TaxID=3134807 RepID=UPI003D16CF38